MNMHGTGEDIDKNSIHTCQRDRGEGEKKKKQKRRNKFEVGLRSNAFDLNERTPECYDQSAQKAGVDRNGCVRCCMRD